MKIEALNCPNCGGNVTSDSAFCRFCGTRLKTEACPKCLGLMFVGAKHCTHCGENVVAVAESDSDPGKCPRCDAGLGAISAAGLVLGQCERCDGIWIDRPTFERVCAEQEKQAAVLAVIPPRTHPPVTEIKYVPCPNCGSLMNRSNFARSSGVIVDTCREHGVWFDADELPKIVEFVRNGGIDRQREKEKRQLDDKRRELNDRERIAAMREARFGGDQFRETGSPLGDFLRRIFD